MTRLKYLLNMAGNDLAVVEVCSPTACLLAGHEDKSDVMLIVRMVRGVERPSRLDYTQKPTWLNPAADTHPHCRETGRTRQTTGHWGRWYGCVANVQALYRLACAARMSAVLEDDPLLRTRMTPSLQIMGATLSSRSHYGKFNSQRLCWHSADYRHTTVAG